MTWWVYLCVTERLPDLPGDRGGAVRARDADHQAVSPQQAEQGGQGTAILVGL